MIHILDTLVAKPGRLTQVTREIKGVYQPLVADLGMQLLDTWMAPAVELRDRPTELLLHWKLARLAMFWRIRFDADNPRIVQFWEDLEPLLSGRSRRIMCDPDDAMVLR